MSLTATVRANVSALLQSQSGLTTALTENPIEFSFDVGDCTTVWSDRRVFPAIGYDEVDFSTIGISTVKVLCIKNLSTTNQIAMTAGWTGSQFTTFRQDTTSWNFSPMINLGSLTLRGYPRAVRSCFPARIHPASRRPPAGRFSASAESAASPTKSM